MRAGIVALALFLAAPARAQDAPPPEPPPAAEESPPSAAQVEAEQAFERGEALFARGNYDAALAEYERAYELLEGHPQAHVLLFNIGQAHERLYRYDRALEYYRRYLDEGGDDAEDRAGVEARMQTLEALLGSARVETNVEGAEIWVDEHRLGAAPATVRLTGGPHVMELRAEGYSPGRREIQIAAGQTLDVRVDLSEQLQGIAPTWFVLVTTAAAAALVAGIVLGSVTLAEREAIDALLDDPMRRFEVVPEDVQPRLLALALATDLMLGVGLGLAVTAAILAALTDWTPGPAETVVVPSAGRDHVGVAIGGAF